MVVQEGDKEAAGYGDHVWEIPKVPEWLSPVVAAIPLQLFAYHVAVARGCDPDRPRNLAKSVTVE
jgi:glucosamine--fructose-6-phosphate aminotransferase (isomerizing)